MSQILRIAGRYAVSSFRNKERYTICESCLLLRSGFGEFSTQAKMEPYTRFFKKRRWKKKKQLPDKQELHDQLIQMVGARLYQLSSSSGKRTNQAELELPVEYHRLNKDSLRLAHISNTEKTTEQTGTQLVIKLDKAVYDNSSSQCEYQTGSQYSDIFSQKNALECDTLLSQGSELQEKYKSVILNQEISDIDKVNIDSKDFIESVIIDKTGQNEATSVTKLQQRKKGKTDIQQKHGKESRHLKQSHKKKRLKEALKEMYGRKNKNIHEKKEKLRKQRSKSELASFYTKSRFRSDMKLADNGKGIEEAKKMFRYMPDDISESELGSSDHLLEVLFEKDTKEIEREEGVTKHDDTEENLDDIEDNVTNRDIGEGIDLSDGRLPDAEWAVIKAIRKKKKDVRNLSIDEMEKLERLQDVFHEDTTFVEEPPTDYAVSEWAEDVRPVEGYLTKQAQKKKKDKWTRGMLRQLKVDEEMILYTKQEIFNQDLLSYVEACVFSGITTKALKDVKMYRGKNDPEFKVTDVRIYNQILRGLAKEEESLEPVREVFSYIREDGLNPNFETYMLCLACVGKSTERSEFDLMMASFIVRDMMDKGFDVKDIFNQCTFLYNERSHVYQLLTEVIPDYEPYSPNVNVKYTGPLVEPLNEMLPLEEKVEVNPFTCGLTKGEVMQAAEKQFAQELDGFVTLNSIFKTHSKTEEKKMAALAKTQEQWRSNLKQAFLARKAQLRKKAYKTQGISIYPFFCLFPDDDYVDILCKEIHWWLSFSQMFSPTCAMLKAQLIERIRKRFSIQQMIDVEVFPKLHKAYSAYISRLTDPNTPIHTQRELWKQIMQRITDGNSMERPAVEWSESVKLTIADIFFDMIVTEATFDTNIFNNKAERLAKAFYVVERSRDGKRNFELKPHPSISLLVNAQTDLVFPTDKMPSLSPPVPYLGPGQGGNFISTVELVRACIDQQVELFKEKTEEAGPVLDSLNVLSTYAWKINQPVLDVVMKVFKEGGNEDLDIPILPESIQRPEKFDQDAQKTDMKTYRKNLFEYKKTVSEATSLWWTALYKLSIANELRDKPFWLAMNIDFRGRSYPVAPHLHHQNQDYVKALMLFVKGKPLGEEGFRWLKLHLVNLTEHKKRSSLEERLVYAEEMLPEILDSANNPLTGNKWWMTAENPWQTLAACKEVAAALKSGDPSTFVSHYPVHQDGSCNGLQHYAAMGRDVTGAKSVNLKSDGPAPADVYSDVVELVKKEIENDIKFQTKDATIAQLCQPYLERKVIKQSIMTTVYGVTMYGAKLQIKRQLGYKEFPDEHIISASRYLAEKTFQCLNNLFTSARQIQNWFDQCSVVIGKGNHAVEWETPLNFVCIQPYFKVLPQPTDMPDKVYHYLCRNSNIMRISNVNKQKNGFAPNFVHSLDSVHMMLTSLYCYRKGLTYGSVHDSFWTHACDVEIMSKITREQFIALHSQPILEDLSNYFIDRYINRGDLTAEQCAKFKSIFTKVPEKGEFDLNDILVSPYFFS